MLHNTKKPDDVEQKDAEGHAAIDTFNPDHTQYPAVIAEIKNGLEPYSSNNNKMVSDPVKKILSVIQRIQNDMKKNPHRHDCIGACKALTHEINKQIELIKKQNTFSEEEKGIVETLLNKLDTFGVMIGKIFKILAAHHEIKATTQLPNSLVSIIQDYFQLPPTPEIIQKINRNLNLLQQYAHYDWNGITITIDRRNDNKNTFGTMADLHRLYLDGVIFKEQQTSNPAGIVGILFSEEKATTMEERRTIMKLEDWYNWYAYDPVNPSKINGTYITFSDALLTGAKFENLLCASFWFNYATLRNASFKSSILTGASFNGADMSNADLSFSYGAALTLFNVPFSSFFEITTLTNANLHKGNFSGAFFNRAILDDANLSEGKFENANFSNSSMKQAKLAKANFTNANFTGANLEGAIFTGATLIGASFKEANLTDAILSGAHFDLNKLTREQVLSLRYLDNNACAYINAIYDYMEQNDETKHKKGFERAQRLIYSFIDGGVPYYENGQNKLLAGFLLTGKLAGEGRLSSMFAASNETDENSLRARLQKVQDNLSSAPVTYHGFNREL